MSTTKPVAVSEKADPAIHAFVDNPEAFLAPPDSVPTGLSSFFIFPGTLLSMPGGLPAEGYFKFVRTKLDNTGGLTYDIKYAGSEPAQDTVWAYSLGYNAGAQTNRKPAFLDVPKQAADKALIFTGTLSGCSVIVTDLDADTYRVFHDSRLESSLLYDNVVMAVDFSDYSLTDSAVALCFLQYRRGGWQMFTQLQTIMSQGSTASLLPRRTAVQLGLKEGYFPLLVTSPGSYDAVDRRVAFDASRQASGERLNRVAIEALSLASIPDVPDGAFSSFSGQEIRDSNPAINHNHAIRDAVELELRIIDLKRVALLDKNPALRSVLSNEEKYLRNILVPVAAESKKLDFTYLWLMQKEAKGINEIIVLDGRLEAPLGNTAGERLVGQEVDMLSSHDQDYAAGYAAYKTTQIPGFSADLSASAMTLLFDSTPQLSSLQKGALLHYISDANEQEYRASIWQRTDDVVQSFQFAGATTKPMPQDILLNAVPDEYGGRCYPLVRAMAVALANSDFAVDQLAAKLIALNNGNDPTNAALMARSLKDLHSSYPAVESSRLVGKLKLGDAIDLLSRPGESAIYALNTEVHSMLIGMRNDNGTPSYHFYDPNFTLATFTSVDTMSRALHNFFVSFGTPYSTTVTDDQWEFTVVQLDPGQLAKIGLDYNLRVADFCAPDTLVETVEVKKATSFPLPSPNRFSGESTLAVSARLLDTLGIAEDWRRATENLESALQLDGNWMPILDSLEEVGNGTYRIQFINIDNPNETRSIDTEDERIQRFKEFITGQLEAVKKAYDFRRGSFINKESTTEGEAIDGLNAMFLVRTIIDMYNGGSGGDGAQGSSSNLAMALKVQIYFNLVQIGHTTIGDVAKVVQLTQSIIRSEQVVETSLSTISKAFGRASDGFGVFLSAASVVFDAYELSNAQSGSQKAVFGTQLAFDSASLVVGLGSLGATIIGASTAAAVLGGGAVLAGGLAVGFTALAQAFGRIADDADAVGKYFGDAEQAYLDGGFQYDAKNQALVPLVGAVISNVDLLTNTVTFDSQYLYRTHHGSTGSGAINYFFWVGDYPTVVHDKSQAINVRAGIGAPDSIRLDLPGPLATLILPATPKSYIDYDWQILPGATTRHDYGFSVLRKLEEDRRFDYDFYIFPCERIVYEITQEYVDTPVTVQLPGSPIRLQPPQLPSAIQGKLRYTLQGNGSVYTVSLVSGANITLSTPSSNSTTWVLDCTQLSYDHVSVEDDSVTIAGIRVDVANHDFANLLLISPQHELFRVDFTTHTADLTEEDASKYAGGSRAIDAHLADLNNKHLLRGSFVVIDNYVDSSNEGVGTAFYEIARDRFLFTVGSPPVLRQNCEVLVTPIEGVVYFYSLTTQAIWRINPIDGTCVAKYHAFYPSSQRTLMRVWQEVDGYVYASFHHWLGFTETSYGILTYILGDDTMTLISIVGDKPLLAQLAGLGSIDYPLDQFITDYALGAPPITVPGPTGGVDIQAKIDAKVVAVLGTDDSNASRWYWVRTVDGLVISPNFTPTSDVVYAGSVTGTNGAPEEFYFYSLKEQTITFQTGTGAGASQPQTVAFPTSFSKLANMICLDGSMFALSDNGFILRLTSTGSFSLEAVNATWISTQESASPSEPWWSVLKNIVENHVASSSKVSVLGLTDPISKAVVPVWYINQTYVALSNTQFPGDTEVQPVGFTKSGRSAWIVYWASAGSGTLYAQPTIPDDQLSNVFSAATPTVDLAKVTSAHVVPVVENVPCKSVAMTEDGLQYITTDGCILLIATDTGSATLIGVDESWQTYHASDLENALASLLEQSWNFGEVIALRGDLSGPPAWYNVPLRKVVGPSGASVTWRDSPAWVGLNIDSTTGFFFLAGSGDLCVITISSNDTTKISGLSLAKRVDDVLILELAGGGYQYLPPIWGVRTAMILENQGGLMGYTIPRKSWEYYESIVLQDKDTAISSSNYPDMVFLDAADPGALLPKKIGEDLVLVDVSNGHSLTIRKAFGADPSYGRVAIRTSLAVDLTTQTMATAQRQLKQIGNFDTPLDVTLQTLVYLCSQSRT